MIPGAQDAVRLALAEDIGPGDVTTESVVPPAARARADVTAKAAGVLAGLPLVALVYKELDPTVRVELHAADGDTVSPGARVCTAQGPARSLLTGERVALNFLQRLSGIATLTARFEKEVQGTRARIVDTRKTTPGLRVLEKYAVRMGGGHNHRLGLYDAVLIKDNHIAAAGGIRQAVEGARARAPHVATITVECETLHQIREALNAGADFILLDNMDTGQLSEAADLVAGRAGLEASGGVSLSTVREIAQTGVDFISVGALTHSAPALDLAMKLELTR